MTTNPDNTAGLEPCPFCGGDLLHACDHGDGTPTVWIACMNCHAEGPLADYLGNAQVAWNTRPQPTPPADIAAVLERIDADLGSQYRGKSEPVLLSPADARALTQYVRAHLSCGEQFAKNAKCPAQPSSVSEALYALQTAILASRGTKADADRRAALKSLQRALSTHLPYKGEAEHRSVEPSSDASVSASPAASLWTPFTFDDGTEVHLMGFNGGADGVWSALQLAFCGSDGSEIFWDYIADGPPEPGRIAAGQSLTSKSEDGSSQKDDAQSPSKTEGAYMSNALSPENRALVERVFAPLSSLPEGAVRSLKIREDRLDELLDAAREEARLQGVPEGWRLVPEEPSAPMLDAGNIDIGCRRDCTLGRLRASDAYRAMIASAPVPPDGEADPTPQEGT